MAKLAAPASEWLVLPNGQRCHVPSLRPCSCGGRVFWFGDGQTMRQSFIRCIVCLPPRGGETALGYIDLARRLLTRRRPAPERTG